ncbi:iron-containing alcohol dehydrogenase, partial [Escherichia coli]|uniref:iron-containing alcohol dehydrogenase n=1 Tax=Escherichia coli TaxID=562 RepID=UPI00312C71E4
LAPDGLLQLDVIPKVAYTEAIVAVGGGKVMDFAKGIIHEWDKPAFFLAVPTTAGSGSEATPFAVFYSGSEKVSLDRPSLLPQMVILDASMVKNLSTQQRAISGADAFCQCIESLWNIKRTDASEGFAAQGLKKLHQHLPAFVKSTDAAVDAEMLDAANL